MTPVPLPSYYKGIQFRSRLESRWAIYFDLIGLAWQYEAEGYTTPHGNYLPDFDCGECGLVEVKPTIDAMLVERGKFWDLACMLKRKVFCVVGPPSLAGHYGWRHDGEAIEACSKQGEVGNIYDPTFCWYAFTYKNWGCPYYGEFAEDTDSPQPWEVVQTVRYENGVAQFNQDDVRAHRDKWRGHLFSANRLAENK